MNKKRIVNIVLDIGKTNTKIFLFNEKNQIINSHFKNFNVIKVDVRQTEFMKNIIKKTKTSAATKVI